MLCAAQHKSKGPEFDPQWGSTFLSSGLLLWPAAYKALTAWWLFLFTLLAWLCGAKENTSYWLFAAKGSIRTIDRQKVVPLS
jgi:hypothetical protein